MEDLSVINCFWVPRIFSAAIINNKNVVATNTCSAHTFDCLISDYYGCGKNVLHVLLTVSMVLMHFGAFLFPLPLFVWPLSMFLLDMSRSTTTMSHISLVLWLRRTATLVIVLIVSSYISALGQSSLFLLPLILLSLLWLSVYYYPWLRLGLEL